MTQKNITPSEYIQERASVPGSKGSMTIEAALALPLFLFAVLSLVYLLEIQAIKIRVETAAQSAAKISAEEVALLSVLNPIKLKADLIHLAGAERLNQSIIEDGCMGIQCWQSYYKQETGEMHICITYRIRLPFPGYKHLGAKQKVEFVMKAWTGYEKPGIESEEDQIVYVTDTGSVYHTEYQCTYLQLSVQFVPLSGLSGLRNVDGGKYYACEKCVHGKSMAGIYITNTGNRYHNSLSCSGLKRSVRAVKKSEVSGMEACSRCTN